MKNTVSKKVLQSDSSYLRYLILSGVVGILAGTVCAYFQMAIAKLIHWPQYLSNYLSGTTLIVCSALIVMVLTVSISAVVRHVAPEASGSGLPYIEMQMQQHEVIRWWRILPVKFFMGIAALSSGLLVGREGPSMQIGSSISIAMTNAFKVSDRERRSMMAAGAAAGLACAFNAPLAAMIFVLGEMRRLSFYSHKNSIGVIVAALTSTMVAQVILGGKPVIPISVAEPSFWFIPAFLVLGCVLGVLGTCFNKSIIWANGFASAMHKRAPYLYPAVVGLTVGVLCIVYPNATTGGEAIIPKLALSDSGFALLLLLVCLRFFGTVGSYSTGVPGGIFAPLLTLAMSAGVAFAALLHLSIPGMDDMALVFGLAAMAGLFAASIRSPIAGVVLVLELTAAYTMVIPLLVTSLGAVFVARVIGGKPIYALMLEKALQQRKI